MNFTDTSPLSQRLAEARARHQTLDSLPPEQIPADFGAAYAIQHEILRLSGSEIGGWKIGWTSRGARDQMGVGFRPFGYVLAGGFKPVSVADFRLEWEHDTNRLVGQRYRVVALVNLLVLK